jgi:hypothetical protein
MLLVSLFIMAARQGRWMPFWLLWLMAGEQLLTSTENRETGRNKLTSHLLYHIILNPSTAASANPFRRGSRGWGGFLQKTMLLEEQMAPSL